MASQSKIGRNDACPCGSGKKYKNCCEGKSQRLTTAGWLAIGTMLIAAAIVVYFVLLSPGGNAPTGARSCPAGQVWSTQHGHCH